MFLKTDKLSIEIFHKGRGRGAGKIGSKTINIENIHRYPVFNSNSNSNSNSSNNSSGNSNSSNNTTLLSMDDNEWKETFFTNYNIWYYNNLHLNLSLSQFTKFIDKQRDFIENRVRIHVLLDKHQALEDHNLSIFKLQKYFNDMAYNGMIVYNYCEFCCNSIAMLSCLVCNESLCLLCYVNEEYHNAIPCYFTENQLY